MRYYKLLNDTEFIGVATSLDLRRIHPKRLNLLACDEDNAQYISCNDKLYRADWMLPEVINDSGCPIVSVIEIDESEYGTLYQAVDNGEVIIIEPEEYESVENIESTDLATEITLEYMISKKVAEMSAECSKNITSGFDVVLSDGNTHHFSLTTQDQLNLITLSAMIASGEIEIPYHADGELCQFYSTEDITIITTAATGFKTYHTSYYNSLKGYIESLTDVESVASIWYGVEIPFDYQSDVLKTIYAVNAEGAA